MLCGDDATRVAILALSRSKNTFRETRCAQEHFANSRNFDNVYTDGNDHKRRPTNEAGFYWREIDGVRALICAPLEQDGFVNGFSTRLGGVSDMPANSLNLAGFNEDAAENILENRRRFLKLFPGQWAFAGCWQVHGADVRVVQ